MENNIIHNGIKFQKYNQYKETKYYRCAKSNKKIRCPAKITIKEGKMFLHGVHNCFNINLEISRNSKRSLSPLIKKYSNDLTLMPSKIYQKIINKISKSKEMETIEIPTKQQITSKIKNIRKGTVPKFIDMFNNELGQTKEKNPFLKSYKKYIHNNKIEELVIWCSEEGISILRQQGQVFIDGTFKCVPSPFVQCIVVLSHDTVTNLYVPCCWALLSSKNENAYWILLQELITLTDWTWSPSICISDFEYELICSIKNQLTNTKIYGCFFHFKQSLFRKMKKIGIIKENICEISNSIDFLTVISIDEIEIALEYIKNKFIIKEQKINEFIEYFKRVWINKYPPILWNYSSMDVNSIVARTNNPIERYNRRLNEQFSTAHTSLIKFINVLQEEESFYTNQIRKIRSGKLKRNLEKGNFKFPIIPKEFIDFTKKLIK